MTDDPEALEPGDGGSDDDTPARGSSPPTPRWVIVLAVVVAVLVLALLALVMVGGHDPSRFQH